MIKINESNRFRKFTKSDWYAFSGAVRSDDGKYPKIAEVDDYTIIISPDEDDYSQYVVSVITPNDYEYYRVFSNESPANRVANDLANGTTSYISDVIETWKRR